MDSHYMVNALQEWSRELSGQSQPWEIPVGLFCFNIHATIHRGNGPIGIEWGYKEYDFEFRWEFDEKEEPNKGEFTIYNISDDTMRKMYTGDVLIVHGGFEAGAGWFFGAGITEINAEWKGPEKVVTIHLADESSNTNHISSGTGYDMGGEAAIEDLGAGGPSVALTYAAGIRASVILNDLVSRASYPVKELSFEQDRVYSEAVIVEGPLYAKLKEFAAVCGSAAYIANGLLVVKNLSINRGSDRLLISQHSGLLDAPTPFTEEGGGDEVPSYRGYTVKMLGNQRIQMGAPVLLQSRFVNAGLTVLRGKHSYDGMNLITEATLVE